jgi:hypothetical protein
MTDPNIIYSGLSQTITVEGHKLRVDIYKLESDPHWQLEVIDEEGTSTVWDDPFDTDQLALDEALRTRDEEGLSGFRDSGNIVPFPQQ